MKSSLVIHRFKLTTLSFSLSLISTVAMASSVKLVNQKTIMKDQTINTGAKAFGIYAEEPNALSSVNLLLENSKIQSGASGIFVNKRAISGAKIGDIHIAVNNSNITTIGGGADGLYVAPAGEGNVEIITDDKTLFNIKGQGNSSFGIAVQVEKANKGNISIDNAATINTIATKGINNSGLLLQSTALVDGNVFYKNKGQLNILPGSHGIHLDIRNNITGSITAINEGNINADNGKNTSTGAGIYIKQMANVAEVAHIINSGTISGFESGILADATTNVSSSIDINLKAGSNITNNMNGIKSNVLNNTDITLEKDAKLTANSTAIYLNNANGKGKAQVTITNAGEISSNTGRLIYSTPQTKHQIAIDNTGTMTGFMDLLGQGQAKVDNSGTWDMSGYTSNFGENTAKNTLVNNGLLITANADNVASKSVFNKVGTFTNAGIMTMENGRAGDTTEINGNFIGNKGTLVLNTALDGDNSATDKLIIKGAATGSTEVQVKNVGGLGAKTVNGIQIIQTVTSESADTFYLKDNYITAGAFDYSLNLKKSEVNANDVSDNWYLESKLAKTTVANQATREPYINSEQPVYTPDVGSYLAIATMGNTLFTSRLEDREGASHFQQLENDKANVWIRTYGAHSKFRSMSDQLRTSGNSFVTQIGAGLVSLGDEDQYNIGVMGGYAYYDGKTRSELTQRESKAQIDGYSLGLYSTWYAHPVEKRGAYIDTWILWNNFKNTVNSADKNQYQFDSSGVTASIEAGGDYLLNKNSHKNWWIQPQAQVIYQGVDVDNFIDAQGQNILGRSDNLQARMGVKTYLAIETRLGKGTSYRPFLALNYIYNTTPYSVEVSHTNYANTSAKNLGEIKLGLEGHVTKNSQVWVNASYISGHSRNQTYQGNIGWKYNF